MEEINNLFNDPSTWIIVLAVIASIFIVAANYFAFKYNNSQSWINTQDSMYVKALLRITELEDLITKRMAKIASQAIQIEVLSDNLAIAEKSTKRKGLRKEVADLKRLNLNYEATIEVLSDQNDKFVYTIDFLKERIQRLTESIEHRKHTKPQPKETGYWTPSGTVQVYPQFELGKVYKEGKTKAGSDALLMLTKENDPTEYMVLKLNFKPVNP